MDLSAKVEANMMQINAQQLSVMAGEPHNQIRAFAEMPVVFDYYPLIWPSGILCQTGAGVIGGTSRKGKAPRGLETHLARFSGALILIGGGFIGVIPTAQCKPIAS